MSSRRFHQSVPNLGIMLGLRTGSVPYPNTWDALNPSYVRTGYSSELEIGLILVFREIGRSACNMLFITRANCIIFYNFVIIYSFVKCGLTALRNLQVKRSKIVLKIHLIWTPILPVDSGATASWPDGSPLLRCAPFHST